MSTTPQNSENITVSLTPEQKQILEKAAAITGLELNNYIMHHALSAALVHLGSYDKIVRSQSATPVSDSPQESFPDTEEQTREKVDSTLREDRNDHVTQNVQIPAIDNSKELNDLAKAMMVSLAWSYADALQKNESSET